MIKTFSFKKYVRKGLAVLLVCNIFLTGNNMEVQAKNYTSKPTKVFDVDRRNNNLGAMAINGSTLYCIHNIDDKKAVLYTYTNYNNSKRKLQSEKCFYGLGHANSMTYNNGSLYVATMQAGTSAIVEINLKTDELTAHSFSHAISGIAYMNDTGKFLICYGGTNKENKRKIAVANIMPELPRRVNSSVNPDIKGLTNEIKKVGSSNKETVSIMMKIGYNISIEKEFYINVSKPIKEGHSTFQSIYYSKGALYINSWKPGTSSNKILKVSIGTNPSKGKTYTASDTITATGSDGFEIESVVMVGTTLYLCANRSSKDGIYKIANAFK